MRSLTLIDVVFCVAVAAASSLAVSQEALASQATGSKPASASPRPTEAPSRSLVSQPGSGGSTLQPGSGGSTLQPGSGGGTLRSEVPTSTSAATAQ